MLATAACCCVPRKPQEPALLEALGIQEIPKHPKTPQTHAMLQTESMLVLVALPLTALFLPSTGSLTAPSVKPCTTETTCDIDGEAACVPSYTDDAAITSHGFLKSTDSTPIKAAPNDGLASGHGESARRTSLTMRLVLLVQ
ncbi:uncharacterized protein [Dermacentor albipictus]|uniref:uncharacterized protein n=1 Tax=Dermacentor albipictus TaxID=60249 RepID=UPI0038FC72FC